MTNLGKLPLSLAFSVAVLSLSCSSKPDKELKAAQEAMEEADKQYASELAPADYQSAKEVWDDAQAALSGSRYGQARPLLLKAKSRFGKARDMAKAKRDRLLAEIQGLQGTIDVRYESLKSLIQSGKGSISSKAAKRLDELCMEIEGGVEKINAAIKQGQYTDAKASAQSTMAKIDETEKQLHSHMTGK